MSLSKLTGRWVAKRLPPRPKDANKGTFGKVLVFAGSENYPGAAYLACAAAYRAGAGLVTLVTEQIVKIIVSKKLPEVTFLSRDEVFNKINEYDVLLIGPGLEQSSQIIEFIQTKTVIDGDGLNILAKTEKWWEKINRGTIRLRRRNNGVILTPHPGEMARLTGLTIKKIQANRVDVVQHFAKKWGTIVVLKGANTVVVSPGGEVLLSPFANPVLATAGTGDVLSGVITGMFAQRLNPFEAASVGVYIHGMAGEILREKVGNTGALASDLLQVIPQVIKQLS